MADIKNFIHMPFHSKNDLHLYCNTSQAHVPVMFQRTTEFISPMMPDIDCWLQAESDPFLSETFFSGVIRSTKRSSLSSSGQYFVSLTLVLRLVL